MYIKYGATDTIVFHGYRTIMNTNHPVVSYVRRNGKNQYVAVYHLCNGVPKSSAVFKTKGAAIESLPHDKLF